MKARWPILSVTALLHCLEMRSRGEESFSFEHIGLAQGLSHNSVSCIAQDSLGMMWFGTRNGLNKYDGNRLTVYYAENGNPNSLPENQIKRIQADGGKLWIQTFGSIAYYDIVNESFTSFPVSGIRSFGLAKDFIWVGTTEGLYKLSISDGCSVHVPLFDTPRELNALLPTESGLVVGTQNGIFMMNVTDGKPRLLVADVASTDLFRDSDGRIWAGSISDGAFCIDTNGSVIHYREGVISHSFVRCIAQDERGDIWFGTLLGLDHLERATGRVITHHSDGNDPTQLSHNSVWALCRDTHGAMWCGTWFGGVNVFNPMRNTFRYYPVRTDHAGLNFRVVGSMCEDGARNLYICTEGAGLNHYDRQTGHFTHYSHNPSDPRSISCNNAKSVVNQGDTVLWVATHTGGLNRFDMRSRTFSTLSGQPSHRRQIPSNTISQIVPYGRRYLLATHNGVVVFDPACDDMERFLPPELHSRVPTNVFALAVAPDGWVWIGCEFAGLARYNPDTGEFRQYTYRAVDPHSIGSNLINSIFIDRLQRVWIATPNGLDRYREERDDFEHFTVGDGLPNNMLLNVTDAHAPGELIVTTSRGVSLFDPTQRRFMNYTDQNGLMLTEINQGGLFRASDGEIFLGGFNGMASFREDRLKEVNPRGHIAITELRINSLPVYPGDSEGILDHNIMLTRKIVLRPRHSLLTLGFSDMALTKERKNKLCYMLEGFDHAWLASDASCRASYSNLPPGRYMFRVRYLDDQQECPDEAALFIRVHPPGYLTWWALMFYGITVAGIVFWLAHMYLLRRRTQYELAHKEAEHRREDEYNRSKLRFFTNVSHEFRTPLTLIAGHLEYLLEKRDIAPAVYKRILKAFKNTTRMQALINELLDFRKQEDGRDHLRVAEQDMVSFLREIFVSYIELAHYRGIDYRFDAPPHRVNLFIDRASMEKVFYNLLTNAFKFTGNGGTIGVGIRQAAGEVRIEVRDTGAGIPQESLERIFDQFYQAENAYGQGTGLGLALARQTVETHGGRMSVSSRLGEGSVFTVTLPEGDAHFSSAQRAPQPDDIPDEVVRDMPETLPERNESKKPLLLVVEDNDEVREFLCEVLAPMYRVEAAADGRQGLEAAIRLQPSLVLSDVMMPGMSGTEMCVALKSDFGTSHIPVILLTARNATEHKVEGLRTGADDYITKPFSIQLLVARIENVIGNRRRLQEKYRTDPDITPEKLAGEGPDARFLEKAQQTVLHHIDNADFSVDDLASAMHMGRSAFFAKIKGVTGSTPNNFILSIRLKYAARIMRTEPQTPVFEVAYRSGFTSPQYFSVSFKKHFGFPPTRYADQKK